MNVSDQKQDARAVMTRASMLQLPKQRNRYFRRTIFFDSLNFPAVRR
jgi:hypothetical protein